MRLNYGEVHMTPVYVKGIPCEFSDMRLDRASLPEGKFLYEVADDDSNGIPARIRPNILVNFYGSVVSDVKFTPDDPNDDVIWLEDGDFIFRR